MRRSRNLGREGSENWSDTGCGSNPTRPWRSIPLPREYEQLGQIAAAQVDLHLQVEVEVLRRAPDAVRADQAGLDPKPGQRRSHPRRRQLSLGSVQMYVLDVGLRDGAPGAAFD